MSKSAAVTAQNAAFTTATSRRREACRLDCTSMDGGGGKGGGHLEKSIDKRPVSDKGCHFLAPPMTFFPISLRRIFRPRFQSAALMDGPDRPILFFFLFFSDLADANYYYRYYMITVITPSYLCFFWWAGRVKKWRRSPSGRADRWKSLDTDQRQCLA